MEREEAIALICSEVKNRNLVSHMLAVGAIMRGIAERLGRDWKLWEITGILHDIDYERTKNNMKEHSLVSAEMLEGKIPENSIKAIKAHNFASTGVLPDSEMDFALIASDAVSGLVIATALIYPSKKLGDVSAESVMKRFGKKDFARNVRREDILLCERIGISLEDFLGLSLKALQEISGEIGL